MRRILIPSDELSWDEILDIRKAALNAAVRSYNTGIQTSEILARANKFEKYLIGNEKKLDT